MSAVLQPADTPSTVETAEKDDEPKDKKKKSDPVEAAKRLAESRERLRQWMIDPDGRHAARRRRLAVGAGEETGEGPSLFDRLRAHPVFGVAAEMVNSWWTRHPLHPVASFAEGAVREHVVPVVRRHPLAVVGGAFAVGALVVWFRPWRWVAGTARSLGSTSHLALKLLGSVPFASLLAAITAMAKRDDGDDAAREQREAEAAAQRAELRADEEALAPLGGLPDGPVPAAERTTVH